MGNIITKAFDATKRVAQAVFNGKPNVFTTNDLNRVMEANRFAFDMLGKTTLPIAGMVVTPRINSGVWSLVVDVYADTDAYGPYVITHGAKFKINAGEYTLSMSTANNGKALYLVGICAGKSLVTFNSDISHDTSGATFSDGTSTPAADHYVYDAMTYSVVKDSDIETLLKNNLIVVPLYKVYVSDYSTSNFDFVQMYQKPYTITDPFKINSVVEFNGVLSLAGGGTGTAGTWKAYIYVGFMLLAFRPITSTLLVTGATLTLDGLGDKVNFYGSSNQALSASMYINLLKGSSTMVVTAGDFGGIELVVGDTVGGIPQMTLKPTPALSGYTVDPAYNSTNSALFRGLFRVSLKNT